MNRDKVFAKKVSSILTIVLQANESAKEVLTSRRPSGIFARGQIEFLQKQEESVIDSLGERLGIPLRSLAKNGKITAGSLLPHVSKIRGRAFVYFNAECLQMTLDSMQLKNVSREELWLKRARAANDRELLQIVVKSLRARFNSQVTLLKVSHASVYLLTALEAYVKECQSLTARMYEARDGSY